VKQNLSDDKSKMKRTSANTMDIKQKIMQPVHEKKIFFFFRCNNKYIVNMARECVLLTVEAFGNVQDLYTASPITCWVFFSLALEYATLVLLNISRQEA